MRVVFIQGGGEGAHAEDARLAADLGERLGHPVAYPLMPREDEPDYERWKPAIAAALDSADVVVAHSIGGYLTVRYIVESGALPSALFVIAAPFPSGDSDWTFEGFDLPADFGSRLADVPTFLYASPDDDVVPHAHLALYARAIPGSIARDTTGGHQLGGDLSVVAADILEF
jgi:predicted alpha/beta hydrolase family esterase